MMSAYRLETILVTHPNVREVCVLPSVAGAGDFRYHAFVALTDNTLAALYDFHSGCDDLLNGIQVRIAVLPELPKSAMGRISRDTLRSMIAETCAKAAS